MSHISNPQFLVVHAYIDMSLQGFVLVRRGFCSGVCLGFLSGRFCSGWILSVPPSVRIHPLQQKAKHHFQFRFHMYEINLKRLMSHTLGPPPPVTSSRTPCPLERDVLCGRPQNCPPKLNLNSSSRQGGAASKTYHSNFCRSYCGRMQSTTAGIFRQKFTKN